MVLGFGALNLDLIYEVEDLGLLKLGDLKLVQGTESILTEDELRLLSERLSKFGTLKRICPGGSASNTCYILSLLGIETAIFGVLGEDKEAEDYLRELPSGIERLILRRGRTGLAYILNDRRTSDSDRIILLFPRSNSDITLDDLRDIDLKRFTWIHMSSFVRKEALLAQIHLKSMAYGRCGLSIDPGEVYSKAGRDLLELMDGMDILFCSERELLSIFGSDLDSCIRNALELVKMVVLKRGKMGASYYTKGESFHAEAERVKAQDTTGAGDVLDGVFLACLLRNETPKEALRKAVKAASISVTKYGRDGYILAAKEAYSC